MTTKFQIASDLHLEFNDFNNLIDNAADYLILAGDIGYPDTPNFNNFFDYYSKKYKKIFYIAGNHEFYSTKYNIDEIKQIIRDLKKHYNNIYFLDNDYFELENDVVIAGTILWSQVPDHNIQLIDASMNDYRKIKNSHDYELSVFDTNEMHKNCCEWLTEIITKFSNKKLIIVTHFLPSFKLINPKYIDSELNCAFASNLDTYFKDNIKYWIFGHSHASTSKIINNTNCISNPHGYDIKENREYNKSLVIEL